MTAPLQASSIQESTDHRQVVKFYDLREYLKHRTIPVYAVDLAKRTQYYGRKISASSISLFFSGSPKMKPKFTTFKIIQVTIEGSESIKIDFAGSPFARDLRR